MLATLANAVVRLVALLHVTILVLWMFLLCVLVAGLYGGATASRRILVVQALPAALGLVLPMPSR